MALCDVGGGNLSPEFVFDKLISIVKTLEFLFGLGIGESSNV